MNGAAHQAQNKEKGIPILWPGSDVVLSLPRCGPLFQGVQKSAAQTQGKLHLSPVFVWEAMNQQQAKELLLQKDGAHSTSQQQNQRLRAK